MERLPLGRFKTAHNRDYETALQEIRAGQKTSHWIWSIFPQLQGLGNSMDSWYYGIQDRKEAEDFMADDMLSSHLREISEELLKLDPPIWKIVGYPDDLKICSCMTLFYAVSGEVVFKDILVKFFNGTPDPITLKMLSSGNNGYEIRISD